MSGRARLFDDLAGLAGGAVSVLAGLRDEAEAIARARVDVVVRTLDLVRREELDAALSLAANARAGQEAMAERLAALEARVAALEGAGRAVGGGPGMVV
jgi:BMFP domain-containing protein YqiC